MSTRGDIVLEIASGLLARVQDRFDETDQDLDELLEARLEGILTSLAEAHLLRLAGEDEAADTEEQILQARYLNLRSGINTRAADAIAHTLRDVFQGTASILLRLI